MAGLVRIGLRRWMIWAPCLPAMTRIRDDNASISRLTAAATDRPASSMSCSSVNCHSSPISASSTAAAEAAVRCVTPRITRSPGASMPSTGAEEDELGGCVAAVRFRCA